MISIDEKKNKINHPENPRESRVERFVQLILSKLYIKYNDEEDSMDHLMDHRYTRQLLVQSDHPRLEKKKQIKEYRFFPRMIFLP